MLDHLRTQSAGSARDTTRLTLIVTACLLLGASFIGLRSCGDVPDAPPEPAFRLPAGDVAGEPVERDRILALGAAPRRDLTPDVLEDLLRAASRAPPERPVETTIAALRDAPFDEIAGHVYEVRGTVSGASRAEFQGELRRLWSVVLQAPDGARAVVVAAGFASDVEEGRPRYVNPFTRDFVREGDEVIVRAIAYQRYVGTVAGIQLGDPAPVLVAMRWRRSPLPVHPISEPTEAAWDDVEDIYKNQTMHVRDPAIYETLRWAKEKGHEALAREISSGERPWTEWGRDTFDLWYEEIRAHAHESRKFTESARGKLWRTSGLLGQFTYQGWEEVGENEQGVDDLYVLDLVSDHYATYGRYLVMRTLTPFPLDVHADVKGNKAERVHVYGYFVKNYTYELDQPTRGQEPPAVVAPLFVVVHIEPYPEPEGLYDSLIWGIALGLVVMGLLFYFVLIRGEHKEAARHEERRRSLRRRIREHEAKRASQATTPPAGTGETGDAGP